jgi:hypothetical protein
MLEQILNSDNAPAQNQGKTPTKKVLMVAYHFPPCTGSSGIQRTLKFSRYLPEYGWQPIVLAPHPRAYRTVREDLVKEIHPATVVKRTWAIDISRHLSIRGIYFRGFALPDKWNSWILSAVPAGISLIKKYKPDLIWCTYPIISAHVIALLLHRITKVPLIADFRDPMLYETWPENNISRKIHGLVERKVVQAALKVIVTTPSTKELYKQRYAELPENKWEVVSNGYDDENFVAFSDHSIQTTNTEKLLFVHSGLMEPQDRDPSKFFEVLSELKRSGTINSGNITVILRATGQDAVYEKQLEQLNIKDIVKLEHHISYSEALMEMQMADGLLLFQGSTCNRQIPAKVYEYLRVFKPIFAMADHNGDTAQLLRENNINTIASLDSFEEINSRFVEFIDLVRKGTAPVSDKDQVIKYSRRALTGELVKIFAKVVSGQSS